MKVFFLKCEFAFFFFCNTYIAEGFPIQMFLLVNPDTSSITTLEKNLEPYIFFSMKGFEVNKIANLQWNYYIQTFLAISTWRKHKVGKGSQSSPFEL